MLNGRLLYVASPHSVVDLSTFAGKLRGERHMALRTVSEKITRLCKREKNAWKVLDDLEDTVQKFAVELEQLVLKKVSMLIIQTFT